MLSSKLLFSESNLEIILLKFYRRMKKLYLVRHAKSSWDNPDLDDFDRPLNKRGKRDAPFMGELLKKLNVNPDLIISSPAKRAYTTAKEIARILGYPKRMITKNEDVYLASAGELLSLINSIPEEVSSVMIFGHNPGFTQICNLLSNANILNIPTSGFVEIHFETENWKDITPGSGKLVAFEYPKKYR